jgi:hypothetical protein
MAKIVVKGVVGARAGKPCSLRSTSMSIRPPTSSAVWTKPVVARWRVPWLRRR